MEPSITRQYGPQFRARCRRGQVPHESGGDKGFTASMASCNRVPGDNHVQMGSREGREKSPFNHALDKVIARHLPVSRSLGRSVAHSCRRRRGSPSTRIGTPIHFAPIAWRVHLLTAVEHLAAGHGGLGIAGTMACQPHSERHQRPIGNAHTRKVQDFVVYATALTACAAVTRAREAAPIPARSDADRPAPAGWAALRLLADVDISFSRNWCWQLRGRTLALGRSAPMLMAASPGRGGGDGAGAGRAQRATGSSPTIANSAAPTAVLSMSSSLSRFSGWRSRSLSLGEGLTDSTGARDGTRADGVLDRGRRRLFSF